MLSTAFAVLVWFAIICGLAAINPMLAFFPALYLLKYLD